MPLPQPSRLDDPELARFAALRDAAEERREALVLLVNLQATHRTESNEHWLDMLRNDYFRLRAVGMSEADRARVLAVLDREFDAEAPDWERVQWALIAAGHGFAGADALAERIHAVLTYPRGEKISDAHAGSLEAGLLALGRQSEPAARALRDEAARTAFWDGAGPVRNPQISTDPARSARDLVSLARSPQDRIEMALGYAARSEHPESPEQPVPAWLDALSRSGNERVDNAADALREELIAPQAPDHPNSRIVSALEEARNHTMAADDYDRLVGLFESELEGTATDWAMVSAILRVAFSHGGHDDRMTALIRQMFERERPDPVPNQQWDAFEVAFSVLGRVGTEESVGLLFEAMEPDFWEAGGPLNRDIPEGYPLRIVGTDSARVAAIEALRFAPAGHAREPLEAFGAKYPALDERYNPSGVYRIGTLPRYSDETMAFWAHRGD